MSEQYHEQNRLLSQQYFSYVTAAKTDHLERDGLASSVRQYRRNADAIAHSPIDITDFYEKHHDLVTLHDPKIGKVARGILTQILEKGSDTLEEALKKGIEVQRIETTQRLWKKR